MGKAELDTTGRRCSMAGRRSSGGESRGWWREVGMTNRSVMGNDRDGGLGRGKEIVLAAAEVGG